MPGDLQYWNAPSGKDEDSDQDTVYLVSSSDFDTPSSLESNRDFNKVSLGVTANMATKYSGGSSDKPGTSTQNDGANEDIAASGQSYAPAPSSSNQGLSGGNAAGGGGDDHRDNDHRLHNEDQIIEDDSHEPRASESSTSSGSIQALVPVDPSLDINTADLWPNVNDRNGHSDESGLSQATTAIPSDSEAISVQNNSVVNPLLGATSSSSTSSSSSKNILKSTSAILDISSTTPSTLSSAVSISSAYDDKKSSTDTSFSRIDTSAMDISSDHSVGGLLSTDGKLGDFHTSNIDIFNNSGARFTSTPSEEIGMIGFHHQEELLEAPEDNELVIPSTQEDLVKISFVIPTVPLPSTSEGLKRKAENEPDELATSKKLSRPTLKLHTLNLTKQEPETAKKRSERAVALEKIGQFIERGLHSPISREAEEIEQPEKSEVNKSESHQKAEEAAAISRKLLFESSHSSSELSSSSGKDSLFTPVVVAPISKKNCDGEESTVSDKTTVDDSLNKKLVLDTTFNEETKKMGNRKEYDNEDIIESSQPIVSRNLIMKPSILSKDDGNFNLRYGPTLQDVESQYFPFEEDKSLVEETEEHVSKTASVVESNSLDRLNEVPESQIAKDGDEVIDEESLSKRQEESDLIVPSSEEETIIPATCETKKPGSNGLFLLPLKTSAKINEGDVNVEGKIVLESNKDENKTDILSSKRRKLTESGDISCEVPKEAPKNENISQHTFQSLSTPKVLRDQEVQTVDDLSSPTAISSNNESQKRAVVRRKTIMVKRIVTEDIIINGRIYKTITEEINEEPIITESYDDSGEYKIAANSQTQEKEILKSRDSSSCKESSGTSSGWLADVSTCKSSSSSASKIPSKVVTPRLSTSVSGTSTSSGSSVGMKTLRSVRRRQFSEFKKTLHLSPDKSLPGDEVASSTPKSSSETKTSKREGKLPKLVEFKATPASADKMSDKRKKIKRKGKTPAAQRRNSSSEEKSSNSKKRSRNSAGDKSSPPREKVILKLNLKKPSPVISPRIDDSRVLKKGARVMAKYRDGYYYPGRAVDQEKHDRWKILYDDGDTRSIRAENILVVELLPVGQNIYVLSQDGFYDSAIVLGYVELNGEIQYAIQMDDGSERQVKQNEVILTTDQAARMEKLPLGTMHGYTSICLDNIIEGKRRSRDHLTVDSPSKSSRREKSDSPSTSANSANEDNVH